MKFRTGIGTNLFRWFGPPDNGDMLFWLDGTLSGSEFVDKSGNGRNFTITGKDFTGSYLPYKSAATISAPASDAVLIAADVNNFLYTAGVANEIPVVSFFQNIDYEDKLFCRHISQSLDGNNVETVDPSVVDIVLYDSARTGGNLTAANAYYSVPTEITSDVIWVTTTGNDTTGDGSKGNPYLTLTKANTVGASKTIYIKTGVYAEAATIYMANGSTWIGLGLVDVSTAATMFATSANINTTLNGLIIGGGTGKAIYYISGDTHNVNRCRMTGDGVVVYVLAGADIELFGCSIITDASSAYALRGRVGFMVNTCVLSGTVTASNSVCWLTHSSAILQTFNFKHNQVNTTIPAGKPFILIDRECTFNFIDNAFASASGLSLFSFNGSNTITGTAVFNYNRVTAVLSHGIFYVLSININLDWTIRYNTLTPTGALTGGVIGILFQIAPTIEYNYIYVPTQPGGGIVLNSTRAPSVANINYNTIVLPADGGQIILGNDANDTFDDAYNESNIIGNKLYGLYWDNPAAGANTSHGIAIFNSIDVKCKYNYINGTNHGVVFKASDRVSAQVNTDAIFSYNLIVNCTNGMLMKTMTGVQCYHNTYYYDLDNSNGGNAVNLLSSTGAAIDNIFKNNIFIHLGDSVSALIYMTDSDQYPGFESDYNLLYTLNDHYGRITDVEAPTYYDFAEWQALTYDLNSTELTPAQVAALFTNAANRDFSLPVGSAAIGAALTLAAAYDDGLDESTDWGDDDELPTIVTKQQTVPWDAGAYVS